MTMELWTGYKQTGSGVITNEGLKWMQALDNAFHSEIQLINNEVLEIQRANYKMQIVVSLIRQLSWTHFIALIPIKNALLRDYYTQMCRIEGWNGKTLRTKIDSMLFEPTAINKKRLGDIAKCGDYE